MHAGAPNEEPYEASERSTSEPGAKSGAGGGAIGATRCGADEDEDEEDDDDSMDAERRRDICAASASAEVARRIANDE